MLPEKILSISRYEFAEEVVRSLATDSESPLYVFDFGARDGVMKARLESLSIEWRGFDVAPLSDDVLSYDLSTPFPEGERSADIVLLLDVLEHLTNPGFGLRNLNKALKQGGSLILTVPNPRWSRSRIHALLTGYPACFTQVDLHGNGHVFTTWPHIVEKLLRDAGFEIQTYVTLDGRTVWPDFKRAIRAPQAILARAFCISIERLDPSACGMSYAFVATKC